MFKTIQEAQDHLRQALGFPVKLRVKEKELPPPPEPEPPKEEEND